MFHHCLTTLIFEWLLLDSVSVLVNLGRQLYQSRFGGLIDHYKQRTYLSYYNKSRSQWRREACKQDIKRISFQRFDPNTRYINECYLHTKVFRTYMIIFSLLSQKSYSYDFGIVVHSLLPSNDTFCPSCGPLWSHITQNQQENLQIYQVPGY